MDEPNRLGGLKLLRSLQFRTILDELHRIQSTDVVLPVAGEGPRELRIRCIVRPEPEQAALLDRLGLRLPERMKVPQVCGIIDPPWPACGRWVKSSQGVYIA